MDMLRILWSGGSQCLKAWTYRDMFLLDICVLVCPFFVTSRLCVCYKLAACTGDAAQSLLSRHGVAGCLRREIHVSVG